MNAINFPSGAKPLENPNAFSHQPPNIGGASVAFMAPWQQQGAPAPAPMAQSPVQPAPAPAVASAPTPAPVMEPKQAPAPLMADSKQYNILQLPESYEACWELAERLSKSSICPVAARNPADVFVMLAKAAALGMNWPDAFSNFYIMPNAKTGEIKVCMYVKAKEGVCRKYGAWSSEVDLVNGTARAWGTRYSDGHKEERVFSGFDASLRGLLKKENGQVVGVGKWADKWPDMLRTRAVGRLLDALFPDVIGGFTSYEEMTDMLLEAELKKEAQKASDDAAKPDEILSKTRRTKKTIKADNASEATVAENATVQTAPEPTDLNSLIETELTADQNPLL